jgi:hypothetical protein
MTTERPSAWQIEQLHQEYISALRLRVRRIALTGFALLAVGFAAGLACGRRRRQA